MCVGASSDCEHPSIPSCSSPIHFHRRRTKRCKVRFRIPVRSSAEEATTGGGGGSEIALQNLKLYLENRCMMEENEKLRRKALLLGQENKALLSELNKKFSHLN